ADAYIDGEDGVHYTAAGYRAMAQLAYDLISPRIDIPGGAAAGMIDPTDLGVSIGEYDGFRSLAWEKGQKGGFAYNAGGLAFALDIENGTVVDNLTIKLSYFWDYHAGGNDWWHFNTTDKDGLSAPSWDGGNPHDNGFGLFSQYGLKQNQCDLLTVSRDKQTLGGTGTDWSVNVGDLNAQNSLYIRGFEVTATLADGTVKKATWGTMRGLRGADDGKTLKIACVGDSLTEGTKGHSYVKNLQNMLGGTCEVRNFGYPGTSVTSKQDLSYFGSSYHQNSLAYKADVVLICIGANDSQPGIWGKNTFKQDYKDIIESYMNQGNDPLILVATGGYCELPDGKNQMIWGHSDERMEKQVQPTQNAVVDELGLTRLDLRAVVKPNADAYIDGEDGVHYTAAGYEAMAKLFYDALVPLVEFPADRGALRAALAKEVTYFEGFTKDSVAAYKAALETAKAVMDSAEATQEEIDAAAAALVAAFEGLRVAGMTGDVDGDEEITSTDARLTLQYSAG
ncbi:MAG: hypothetical protein J6R77_01735, partial [Clostridia bacterium]|nr:hypothetical protein [Clostridia bacterium]